MRSHSSPIDPPSAQRSSSAELDVNRGLSLQKAGDLAGAVECFRRALTLDPGSFTAYNNLGSVFASLRDWKTALVFCHAAIALNPSVAEIHSNLAHIYLKQGETQAAIESYRKATALEPQEALYANSLGNSLRLAGQYSEAEESMRRALFLDPNYAEAYVNVGFLFYEQLRPAHLVEECYRRAIALKPDLAQAHVNLSHCLLRRESFEEGWAEHEWRWKWKAFTSPKRNFEQPQWRGEEITGARILLHAEQGLGDTIQFLRYLPMVAKCGAQIILEVQPELRSLVAKTAGAAELIARGDPLPEFDWHCPLLSLPLAFSTDLASIPALVPYLRSGPETPEWLKKERSMDLHVGLVWAGNANNSVDRKRSIPLLALASLWEVEGISLYSLQRGTVSQEAETTPFHFAGSQPQTGDFAATAAAISHLDLIVSVDTSVAHLAGALGKPVWIMLPRTSDWRWLTSREDSPWYPSAKLFRQEVAGDWEHVIASVAAELSLAVRNRKFGL